MVKQSVRLHQYKSTPMLAGIFVVAYGLIIDDRCCTLPKQVYYLLFSPEMQLYLEQSNTTTHLCPPHQIDTRTIMFQTCI